jgi:hypothetical protein
LTDTPYLLKISDIEQLTDYQIWRIYGKDRDPNGKARPIDATYSSARESALVDEKNKYIGMGLALGMKLDELISAWSASNGNRG